MSCLPAGFKRHRHKCKLSCSSKPFCSAASSPGDDVGPGLATPSAAMCLRQRTARRHEWKHLQSRSTFLLLTSTGEAEEGPFGCAGNQAERYYCLCCTSFE